MKKLSLTTLGMILMVSIGYATPLSTQEKNIQTINHNTQKEASIVYQEPTTGIEIVFTPDGTNWEKIIANGESELLFGDRKDVRKATSKAILRAKANIAKFMQEKLTTTETLEEITKTIANSINSNGTVSTAAERKTVETVIESISNSSEAILKGIIVLEQQINQEDKYVKIQVGVSRKTMKAADSLSHDMNRNMSQPKETKNSTVQQYNDGKNEIRRSKNYNNF